MVKFKNYFISTKATFKCCKVPRRDPDYISYDRYDHVSSKYWYGTDKNGDYVIRWSLHWSGLKVTAPRKSHRYDFRISHNDEDAYYFKYRGRMISFNCKKVASCDWKLIGTYGGTCGKCYLKNFKRIT